MDDSKLNLIKMMLSFCLLHPHSANSAVTTFRKTPSRIAFRTFATRLHVPNGRAYRVNATDYFDICVSHFNIKSSFVTIKNEKGN